MGRRRLRLPVDDDDEDDDGEEQQLQTLIVNRPGAYASPPAPPQPPPPEPPLEISDEDEDFADVPDAFSPTSPPPPPPPPPPEPSSADGGEPGRSGMSDRALSGVDGGGEGLSGPVDGLLRTLGLRLRRDWLESCLACLSGSHIGFPGLNDAGKAKLCFEQFLFSDMNFSGGGVLPENVTGMHGVALEGPYVLQVDEIVNISSPLRDRYHDAPAGSKRCLKLSLTDGIQRVYGMEYRPIAQLKALAPAGLKIAIRNVHIWRGLLMLVPEVIEVLGGLVKDLEAARERLVHEVNKPPWGKRKQPVLSLSERASLAAWPSNITSDIEQANLSIPRDADFPYIVRQANVAASSVSSVEPVEGVAADRHTGRNILEQSVAVHTRITSEQRPSPCTSRGIEEFVDSHTGRNITEDVSAQQRQHTEKFSTTCTGRGSTEQLTVQGTIGSVTRQSATQQSGECYVEESTVAHNFIDSDLHVSSTSSLGEHDIDMADTMEHLLILSGEREIPFTYLACLLAKWAAKEDGLSSIQGKIKCFLTGVKGFQFKHRSTYELRVYVDDGSLISEVLVDHHVVEKGIGHSPKEVSAALASSDRTTSSNMREAMKRFQLFLTKFEGTMLVEINQERTIPVALEMSPGYSTSDAWLLLRRLKRFTASLTPQQQSLIIDVSP